MCEIVFWCIFDSRMMMLAWGLNQFLFLVRFRPYWFLWFFDKSNGYPGPAGFCMFLLITIFSKFWRLGDWWIWYVIFWLLCYNSLLLFLVFVTGWRFEILSPSSLAFCTILLPLICFYSYFMFLLLLAILLQFVLYPFPA